jgi:glycosyltransferase involved in cell wall biosynthesis
VNVLQLISSGLGYYGAERVVVTLSSALDQLGVNVIVGAFRNTAKDDHLEVLAHAADRGLKTEQIACDGRFDRKAVLAIRKLIDDHSIDIVHCHGIKPALYAFLAQRSGRAAVVSTCHLWVFDSTKDWLVSALERCILHSVDHVVAVSDHIIPQLRRFGVRGSVIYNGIDLEPFRGSGSDARQSLNWVGRPVVGAIGRLAPQKGLPTLLHAARDVLQLVPNALFVFVGDGPDKEALQVQARELGIAGSVSFLGVREDIPEILSSVDVVALPSLSEGLPMVLLEAMASGAAVVASRVGAVPRVVDDRVNGILMSPGDVCGLTVALLDLLRSKQLRLGIGQEARKTVELRFSAPAMAQRYLGVYRSVAKPSSPMFTDKRQTPTF